MRNGPILDPIAIRTGAYGRGWLPVTAQSIANDVQRGPSREAKDAAKQASRLPYSRASFERVAHLVGEHWLREHADIEDQLSREFDLPTETVAVSVALDRVSVPMEEASKRPPGRPRNGAPQRPVDRNFRMAYCATITMHDANGESLHTPFRKSVVGVTGSSIRICVLAIRNLHAPRRRADYAMCRGLRPRSAAAWRLRSHGTTQWLEENVASVSERGSQLFYQCQQFREVATRIGSRLHDALSPNSPLRSEAVLCEKLRHTLVTGVRIVEANKYTICPDLTAARVVQSRLDRRANGPSVVVVAKKEDGGQKNITALYANVVFTDGHDLKRRWSVRVRASRVVGALQGIPCDIRRNLGFECGSRRNALEQHSDVQPARLVGARTTLDDHPNALQAATRWALDSDTRGQRAKDAEAGVPKVYPGRPWLVDEHRCRPSRCNGLTPLRSHAEDERKQPADIGAKGEASAPRTEPLPRAVVVSTPVFNKSPEAATTGSRQLA